MRQRRTLSFLSKNIGGTERLADNKIIVPEKKIITNATLADRAVAFISALKHTKGEL